MKADRCQWGAPTPARPLSRFYPLRGHALTLACVYGPWRPSGSVAGAGFFSVVWSAPTGDFWAPLHDFDAATRLQLIDACRMHDQEAASPGFARGVCDA